MALVGSLTVLDVDDKKPSTSVLNQLVDIVQTDISESVSRREYQVFITGGVGPGVTSSLFQTVYDQDFTLGTANPIFDMTVGLFRESDTVTNADIGTDTSGKILFPSTSLMMREKIDIYSQYAKALLGTSGSQFYSPFESTDSVNRIDEALFISFKRLFARDSIKKETFAMRFYRTGTMSNRESPSQPVRSTLDVTSQSGSAIFTDFGASTNSRRTFGGEVGNIVEATNTANKVGLIFYDHGTAVLDLKKIMSGTQHVSGVIKAMNNNVTPSFAAGNTFIGSPLSENPDAKYIPDLLVSASIDDIVDHLASCRFQTGSLTAITFQNNTRINSALFFCRASADQYNFSSNPTFRDAGSGRIQVIDAGQELNQRSFTFATTIGLHDSLGNLLAVAKLSRPVEKNDERDITFRVRLDF